MASEDVIELGSSDDETEPAQKKSKPMPNAMVCIPGKLHDVTIKPAKLNANPVRKGVVTGRGVIGKAVMGKGVTGRGVIGKGATVSKSAKVIANPFANLAKGNSKPVQKVMKPNLNSNLKLVKPILIQKPSNQNRHISHAKVPPDVVNTNSHVLKKPIQIIPATNTLNLPPSITVKRTTQCSRKPIIFLNTTSAAKAQLNLKQGNEVPTVELDDDEGPSLISSPAWYLRPEEQIQKTTIEEENNKEPEQLQMIEITIEDSPIKPPLNKRTCEIGAELAITIDDSPAKTSVGKDESVSGSEDETSSSKVSHSKKKLDYPKEAENQQLKSVEIEIEFVPQEVYEDKASMDKDKNEVLKAVSTVSIKTIPETSKNVESSDTITQVKNNSMESNKIDIPTSCAKSEFHSVYQNFIDLCFELENSDDMMKIVEKKIKGYYRQVPKEYTESEEFIDMVASKVFAMKASPEKMYLYIKDIVDELNMQRKLTKSQIVNVEMKTEEKEQAEAIYGEEDSDYGSKRQRQIRKLEKTIKKLHRAIQKLEEQEVDFDDDDDSVYLLTERYKERMVRVYAKFCQLTNTKMPSEPRIQVDARPGHPMGPAKRLEKWINKKVPIGTPLPFPDFHDVLRCVRDANDEDKLGWNEADIMEEARDLFTRCGKKLQRRRQENEWRLAASRIALEVDPAENNEQLKYKLEENKKVAANKEAEIFNKYADRQNQLKLEAVEIGDKEAEESPVESEDDEANEESVSLENKDKRKERLKRLLQERAKRVSEAKENQPAMEFKSSDAQLPDSANTTVSKIADSENNVQEKKEDTDPEKSDSNKEPNNPAETLSVSDDSNNLESDIDELHLLQKLHSGNEAQTSTLESSDSDSPIAVSDSLDSCSDSKKQLSDVISIENSSYSENELESVGSTAIINTDTIELVVPDGMQNKETETKVCADMETECLNDITEKLSSPAVMETTCSNPVMTTGSLTAGTEKPHRKSNNDEYNEPVENILLASSEDETGGSQDDGVIEGACINLRDDLISIDETVVGKPAKDNEVEQNIIIPNTESNVNNPSVVDINAKSVVLDVVEIPGKYEYVNNIEPMKTSQIDAISASNPESIQNGASVASDQTQSAETDRMDIDQDESGEELKTKSSIEINVSTATSLEA